MTRSEHYEAGSEGVAADELRSFIERVERLNEEIKALNDDKKEIFAESKGRGFDNVVIKDIVKLRAKDPDARAEYSAIMKLYCGALGIVL